MIRAHHLNNRIHIAVIGGNGFIGKHFIHRLSNQPNIRIWSIDKREHHVHLELKDPKAIVHEIQLDVSNVGAIKAWLVANPVDFVIFAAGYESPTDGLHPKYSEEIRALSGLSETLEALRNIPLHEEDDKPYFMYLSSVSVYGSNNKKISTESSKLYPASYSGMAKLTGEDMVARLCSKMGIDFSILRLAEVYGRRHHRQLTTQGFWPGYLAYYVDQAVLYKVTDKPLDVFSPDTKVDLVNVNYVTKVMVDMIANRRTGTFNVGSGHYTTLKELSSKVAGQYVVSHKDEVLPVLNFNKRLKIEDLTVDSSKIRSLVDYDHDAYNVDHFLNDYIKVRRFEIAKDKAVEQIMSQKYTLDSTAYGSKEAYRKRQKERLLTTLQIKEIAGDQFEKIEYGRFQDRARALISGKENRLLIDTELDKIEKHEQFRASQLDKAQKTKKIAGRPRKNKKKSKK